MLSRKCFLRSKYPRNPYAPKTCNRRNRTQCGMLLRNAASSMSMYFLSEQMYSPISSCRSSSGYNALACHRNDTRSYCTGPRRPPWKSMNVGLSCSSSMTLRAWKSRYINPRSFSPDKSSAILRKHSSSLISLNSTPVAFRKQYLK